VLGRSGQKILRTAIAALCPRDGIFEEQAGAAGQADEAVLATVLGFLPYMPAPTRLLFPLGLGLLEFGAPFTGGGPRRFSRMDGPQAAAYLRCWERAGGLRTLLFQGVRALVLISFYQQPETLRAMEIDWQGRADTLTRKRAQLLA